MQTRCVRCRSPKKGRQAAFFVEYQHLVLDGPEHVAKSDWIGHGWCDPCCTECFRQLLVTSELTWLKAIPLPDVAATSQESN